MMASWHLPTDEQLDTFLALTIEQRGEQLLSMSISAKAAITMAYARREGCTAREIEDTKFKVWQNRYLDNLNLVPRATAGRESWQALLDKTSHDKAAELLLSHVLHSYVIEQINQRIATDNTFAASIGARIQLFLGGRGAE